MLCSCDVLVIFRPLFKLDLYMCVCVCQQLWANYEEKPKEEVAQFTEEKERVAKYRAVYVTEITDGLHFYAQDVETGECCPHF